MNKLRVILVDDEIQAIEYLKELIDWNKYGFEVVAECTDGKRVLESFEKLDPHIIIADISMPGMNGLQLCEKIKEHNPNCQVILLTAYSEFEYAKKAIELGVSNYLLKHTVDEKTLLEELHKVKQATIHQLSVKEIVTKHTMRHYIEGDEVPVLKIKEGWYFTQDNTDTLVMFVVKLDTPYRLIGIEQNQNKPMIYVEDKIKKIIDALPEKFDFVDVIKYKQDEHILFFRLKEQLSNRIVFLRFHPIAELINETLAAETGYTFSTAITNTSLAVAKISDMYQQCQRALDFLAAKGRSKVLKADDYMDYPLNKNRITQVNQHIYAVIHALESTEASEIDKNVERIFNFIMEPVFDPELLRTCCTGIEREITWWRNERNLPSIKSSSPKVYERLLKCYTAADIKEALKEVCKLCNRQLVDKNINAYSKKVQRAIQYLNENYSKDLVVLDVANVLEISESSLGKTFKQETGYSVLEYLKMIRMHKAKQLLRNTNLKIYEISERVGYKTSQYFSQVFIKSVGLNPLEYREERNESF
ncbi:MAG: putative response regulatory protein [Clostridia bacterium]|jgi:YesN/AraC family two-component response regulator|nr:putative response regulatory protein [Clostridia bacterium]